GIEFAENIVDQVDRQAVPRFGERLALGQLESERERALLALARELTRRQSIHRQGKVVAMRPHETLTLASFLLPGLLQGRAEIGATRRAVGQLKLLVTPAHIPLRPGRQR